jgi:hypothetical protein
MHRFIPELRKSRAGSWDTARGTWSKSGGKAHDAPALSSRVTAAAPDGDAF